MSRGRSISHVREQARDPSIEKDRQGRGDTDKEVKSQDGQAGRHRSGSRADHLGSGDSRVTSTSKPKERAPSGEEVGFKPAAPRHILIKQNQVVLVRLASEEDYFAVKQEARPPLANSADLVDNNFIPVPVKYIKVTSCGGVKWSMNR